MVSRNIRELPAVLGRTRVEEEVKSAFCSAFELELDASSRIDLYTPQALFEFKYQINLTSIAGRSKVIAQTMYYLRRLKLGSDPRPIPPIIGGVDKNHAFFTATAAYKGVYGSAAYDWDRAPSTPDPRIVLAVAAIAETRDAHVYSFQLDASYDNFVDRLFSILRAQGELDLGDTDKKLIDEYNFIEAFRVWDAQFGEYVEGNTKASEFFLADIRDGGSHRLSQSDVAFEMSVGGTMYKRPMPMSEYDHFWNTYEKVRSPRTLVAIRQRFDRMTVENVRRFTGEFYTPIDHAAKGIEYLERVVGKKWWERGYRLWDMAAGSGNLEYELPEEALPFTYISTLLEDDANYCKSLYPTATVFRYDYLNDDVDTLFDNPLGLEYEHVQTRMPARLLTELRDPNIKWIVFINPPFATANVGSRTSELSKDNVSMTRVRALMTANNLGETSRELFSQFLWRINQEFGDREAYLGLFSKIKYLNANNDQKMRDGFFRYQFRGGFCFPAVAFHGNRGKFPVGFLVWQLDKKRSLEDQEIRLDVFNLDLEKTGTKLISSGSRENYLSKWVPRPRTAPDAWPPLSSALTVAHERADSRNRVAPGFLASMMAKGNEMANQNFTALFSAPYTSAGAFSVIPQNFERAMILHTVRRLPQATWLNDRDQFMAPTEEILDPEFVGDCVIWSLFADSNGTAAMKDVEYNGRLYQIRNNIYPYLLTEVQEWEVGLSTLQSSLVSANSDRFGAQWIQKNPLSSEATTVLDAGRSAYRAFYRLSNLVRHAHWKIGLWDVGWHQIRMSLGDRDLAAPELSAVRKAHAALGRKILPRLHDLGFLMAGEVSFAEELTELDETLREIES